MTKENLNNLLVTKFYSANKLQQTKLLQFIFTSINNHDYVVDLLNNKTLTCIEKHFKEREYILIPINISCYPEIDKKYYEDNALIVNDLYIRVQVIYINPINGYIAIQVMTLHDNEQTIEVSSYHFLDQSQLTLL